MKITIEGCPEEITALVQATQGQQISIDSIAEDWVNRLYEAAHGTFQASAS